jgi:hypothetical protein
VPELGWLKDNHGKKIGNLETILSQIETNYGTAAGRLRQWYWTIDKVEETKGVGEEYAQKLKGWFERVFLILFMNHESQTEWHRAIPLQMLVSNVGTAPAINVTADIYLPKMKHTAFPNGVDLPAPPPVPEDLRSILGLGTGEIPVATQLDAPAWYQAQENQKIPIELKQRELFFRSENETQDRATTSIKTIEHGQSVLFRAIYPSLQYERPKDICLNYKLHASNQPTDISGEIVISIDERKSSHG